MRGGTSASSDLNCPKLVNSMLLTPCSILSRAQHIARATRSPSRRRRSAHDGIWDLQNQLHRPHNAGERIKDRLRNLWTNLRSGFFRVWRILPPYWGLSLTRSYHAMSCHSLYVRRHFLDTCSFISFFGGCAGGLQDPTATVSYARVSPGVPAFSNGSHGLEKG